MPSNLKQLGISREGFLRKRDGVLKNYYNFDYKADLYEYLNGYFGGKGFTIRVDTSLLGTNSSRVDRYIRCNRFRLSIGIKGSDLDVKSNILLTLIVDREVRNSGGYVNEVRVNYNEDKHKNLKVKLYAKELINMAETWLQSATVPISVLLDSDISSTVEGVSKLDNELFKEFLVHNCECRDTIRTEIDVTKVSQGVFKQEMVYTTFDLDTWYLGHWDLLGLVKPKNQTEYCKPVRVVNRKVVK